MDRISWVLYVADGGSDKYVSVCGAQILFGRTPGKGGVEKIRVDLSSLREACPGMFVILNANSAVVN